MKKYKILAISFCLLLGATTLIHTEQNPDIERQLKITQLKNQIYELKQQIEALEKELQSLTRNYYVYMPEHFPSVQRIPDDWQVFEYNGMVYFSIPLKQEQKKEKQEKK